MTAREMQIAFQDAFERAGLELNLTSTEVFKELNDAQDQIIAELFKNFEQTNQISAALAPLVVRNLSINTTYPAASVLQGFTLDRVPFPADFRYFIALRAQVEWVYGGYAGTTVDGNSNRTVTDASPDTSIRPVKIAQQDDVYRLLSDPFNKADHKQPLAVIHDDAADIYSDDATFVCPKGYLDYLRDPATISITGAGTPSDLPDDLHRQIVDTAVERYLQRTTSVRATTNQAE